MKIGIAEVALRAGVSDATVSRVINGRRGVSAETRAAVHRAMEELEFHRKLPSRVVAVVANPGDAVLMSMFEMIEVRLAADGLQPVLVPAPREAEYLVSLVDLGICGAIFLSTASNAAEGGDLSTYRLLESRRLPYVCMNGLIDGGSGPSFSTDEAMAAEIAAQHLWMSGHRRIGLVSGPRGSRPADRRVAGFVEAMTKLGADDPEQWVRRQAYSVEGGQAAGERFLDDGATAIMAATDLMALGVIRAAQRRGVTVPEDLSVVGSNDSLSLEFTSPPLTSVRLPTAKISAAIAQALTDLTAGRDVPADEIFFRPELVLRGSTAPPQT